MGMVGILEVTSMIIGKFGGNPFASENQAITFQNKYKVKGTVVPHSWGFAVEVEPLICGLDQVQLSQRDLNVTREKVYGEFVADFRKTEPANKKTYSADYVKGDDRIVSHGIDKILSECYERRSELDSHTADWLRRTIYVCRKVGEDQMTAIAPRLYGLTKRLGIKI